jgi:hypothetical protein
MIPQNITMFSGDDRQPLVQILQPTSQSPQDITGWTITMYIKERSQVPDSASIAIPGVLVNPTSGLVAFTLTSGETQTLDGLQYYVVRAIDNLGHRQTLLTGSLIMKAA